MSRLGSTALLAGSCLFAASMFGGDGAGAAPAASATISGEFVVYERSYSSSPDTNIGPFDHHQVFHPGGVGPAGQVCSPDRLNIARNEVTFTFDTAGGPVVGAAVLDMTCEYHPGCGWVGRTERAAFTGEVDADQRLLRGDVELSHSGGETTSWGSDENDVFGCLESTWVQEPESFAATWLLDLDANIGYVTSSLCTDDPVKRIGWFTITDGVGLVGPSVEYVAGDQMASPRCAARAATPDQASGTAVPVGADVAAPVTAVDSSSDATLDEQAGQADGSTGVDAASSEAGETVGAGADGLDTGSLSQTELFALVVLALVTIGVAGWLGKAIFDRFFKLPTGIESFDPISGELFPGGTEKETPAGPAEPATSVAAEPAKPPPDPGEMGAEHAASIVLDLPGGFMAPITADVQIAQPPGHGEPGWEWHQADPEDPIGIADPEHSELLAVIEPGQWYQTRSGPGGRRDITLYDATGKPITSGVVVRPQSP